MRFARRCLLLLACVAFSAVSADEVLHLALKDEALVSGWHISVSDVVAMESLPAGAASQLMHVDLGSAPLPDHSDRRSRMEVERALRSAGVSAKVAWSGAQSTHITRVGKPFESRQLVDRAEQIVQSAWDGKADEVSITLDGPMNDPLLPLGNVQICPRPAQAERALHRHASIWLDLTVDGQFVRSVQVSLSVNAFRRVWVTKHDLKKGAPPECDALVLQRIDVAEVGGAAIGAPCESLTGVLARDVPAGQPLLAANLRVPAAVATGESVDLEMMAGAFKVESRAIALADGEVGQRIAVKPSSATDSINAEVVAPGVVRVTQR